jgi:gas vesicle protein
MSKQSNTLLGIITGVAIGGALGILFAPKAGKETREELSLRAQELAEQASETKSNLTAKLSEVSAQEQERIKGYIAQLDSYIQGMIGSVGEKASITDESNGKSA